MTARDIDAMTFGAMQLGDGRYRAHADADALKVRERDDSSETPVILARDHRNCRAKIHGDSFPGCQVTTGGHWKLTVQIVMALKQLPRSHFAAMHFELDRGPPKTPPCEFASSHIENPVWLKPGGDVVMA